MNSVPQIPQTDNPYELAMHVRNIRYHEQHQFNPRLEALHAAPEQGAWQPIETAPKDGTRIVIWNKQYDYCPIAKWGEQDADDCYFFGWHFEGWAGPCPTCEDNFIGWNEDIEDGVMPTHWMPLPCVPQSPLSEHQSDDATAQAVVVP